MLVGPEGTERAWTQVYRSLDHRATKENCLRKEFIERFPDGIQDFASMFVEMQAKRHRADYDPRALFSKSSVAADIDAAAAAMSAFHRVSARHRRAFAVYVMLGRPRS
jgi:hypothetical protein